MGLEKQFAAVPFGLDDLQTPSALNAQMNCAVLKSASCVSQRAVVVAVLHRLLPRKVMLPQQRVCPLWAG